MCFRKEKHVCWASLLFFFWIASSFTAFFFFWSSSIENAVFFLFFKQKSVFSTFSSTTASFIILLTPFFCFYVWDFVGERSLPLYVSSVYAVHTLWKKKKSGWMSYLAIFGTHALLVHILWQFWRWNAESGCPSHGSRSARKCKKKKKKLLRTLFFFWVFAVAES